jgi:hypothetical protein
LIAAGLCLAGGGASRASSISFVGQATGANGHRLAAAAHFELTDATNLRVTLTNTSNQAYGGANGSATLASLLTSLVFETDPSQLAINPLRAATAASVVQGGVARFTVTAGPHDVMAVAVPVGLDADPSAAAVNRNRGGWASAPPTGPDDGTINLGVVSPGRLDPTPIFGIINDEYAGQGADGLTRFRLVRDAVAFDFAVVAGFDLNDIHDVRFVYGLDGNGPSFGGIAQLGGVPSLPVPGALVLLGTGLAPMGWFAARRRRPAGR